MVTYQEKRWLINPILTSIQEWGKNEGRAITEMTRATEKFIFDGQVNDKKKVKALVSLQNILHRNIEKIAILNARLSLKLETLKDKED